MFRVYFVGYGSERTCTETKSPKQTLKSDKLLMSPQRFLFRRHDSASSHSPFGPLQANALNFRPRSLELGQQSCKKHSDLNASLCIQMPSRWWARQRGYEFCGFQGCRGFRALVFGFNGWFSVYASFFPGLRVFGL